MDSKQAARAANKVFEAAVLPPLPPGSEYLAPADEALRRDHAMVVALRGNVHAKAEALVSAFPAPADPETPLVRHSRLLPLPPSNGGTTWSRPLFLVVEQNLREDGGISSVSLRYYVHGYEGDEARLPEGRAPVTLLDRENEEVLVIPTVVETTPTEGAFPSEFPHDLLNAGAFAEFVQAQWADVAEMRIGIDMALRGSLPEAASAAARR
jgi:hypothetical protein